MPIQTIISPTTVTAGLPQAKTNAATPTQTGLVYTISRLLGSTSTLSLITGTNSNLTLSGTSVLATAALGTVNSQQAVIREVNGDLAVEYPVTITTPASVPAAPTLGTVTSASGQLSVAFTDGATGGVAITSHNVYRGTVSGSETLLGNLTGATPFIDNSLTNGTQYFYKFTAINSVGESALSNEVSGIPNAIALAVLSLSSLTTTPYVTWTATISGKTAGSTLTATSSDGTALTISGTTVSGMFTTIGTPTVTITETLAGASNTPNANPLSFTVAANQLPRSSAILAKYSPGDIATQQPGITDGTLLPSWTDSVSAVPVTQATASKQPKYKTSGAGGKPYVLHSPTYGSGAGLVSSTSNAVSTVLASSASTIITIIRNTVATTAGSPFVGQYAYRQHLFANGTKAGCDSSPGESLYSHPATGFTVLAYSSGTVGGTINGRTYINGTCIFNATPTKASGSVAFALGGASGAGFEYSGEQYDTIVYNVVLTPAEILQVVKWACDFYSQPYPWVGAPYFRVFDGDSIMTGQYTSSADKTPCARVAAANAWPLGTWTNMGKPGYTMAQMTTVAPTDIDTLQAQLGTVKTELFAWEWTNERALTGAQAWTNFQTYLIARRSAGFTRIVVGTSIDVGGTYRNTTQDSARNDYNTLISNNWATYADGYVAFHTDPNVGVANAIPNAAPFGTYFKTAYPFNSNSTTLPTGLSQASGSTTLTTTNDVLYAGVYLNDSRYPANTTITLKNSAGNYTTSNAPTAAVSGTISLLVGEGVHPGDDGAQVLGSLIAPQMQ